MHMRRNKGSWLQSATDRVTDPDWRHDVVDQASDMATQLASEVARRSTDLGSQVGERMNEVAHNVSDEAHTRLAQQGSRPRRHRLRNLVLLSGAGAVAAYFFDPANGRERRTRARQRTSTSARHLGNGLDRAAHAAHEAADVSADGATPPVRKSR